MLLSSQAKHALNVAPYSEVAYPASSQVISCPCVLERVLPHRSAHCGDDGATRSDCATDGMRRRSAEVARLCILRLELTSSGVAQGAGVAVYSQDRYPPIRAILLLHEQWGCSPKSRP